MTAPGQIKRGDQLRFRTGGVDVERTALLILESGTDGEEIVYDVENNYYFITVMAINGKSHAKDVEYRARGGDAVGGEQ